MTDIQNFFREAFKLLFKTPLLWLFAVLSAIGTFLGTSTNNVPSLVAITCVLSILMLVLSYIAQVGQIYSAHRAVTGLPAAAGEALATAGEVVWRMIVLYLILIAAAIPFGCLAAVLMGTGMDPDNVLVVLGPLSLLMALIQPIFSFAQFNIVVKKQGAWQGLKTALATFMDHFLTLAGISLLFLVLSLGTTILLTVVLLLFLGGDFADILGSLSIITPTDILASGFMQALVTAAAYLLFTPLSYLVYMLAYQDYFLLPEEAQKPAQPAAPTAGPSSTGH